MFPARRPTILAGLDFDISALLLEDRNVSPPNFTKLSTPSSLHILANSPVNSPRRCQRLWPALKTSSFKYTEGAH